VTVNVTPTFGLRIPPCRSAIDVADCVRRADEAGFDIAWVPDSQFLWRDVWATLALSSTVAPSIQLGTCVTNFETRHASVTAAAAGTLDELAPGRVILGVGTGDSSIKTLGLEPTRLARMREQITLVRALLRGEEVAFNGRSMRIEAGSDGHVPIYMAANAPKALGLAGELCDGVILLAGFRPELIQGALGHVAVGAERAGRTLDDIDVCVGAVCHVTDDRLEAAQVVRPFVVATVQTGGGEAMRAAGIDIDPPAVVAGIYPDMSHARDWDAASEAAREWADDDVALRYADQFCLIGSAEHCVERLRQAVDAGATSFYIRHVSSYSMPEEVLRAYSELVIPAFRAQ
jgi:5,10-methylenetetrahydromethanopterin reductase